MNNSVTSRTPAVNHTGMAIEYGTLALLMENLVQQPVLVMPLERTVQHGSVTIFQWAIHVTACATINSPIAYATFPAAEIKQTALGNLIIYPPQQSREEATKQHAQHLQRQLLACILTLLEQCPQVSRVFTPARLRLPDEWIWSSRGAEERIACRDGAWVLLEEKQNHV